ncbi:hypothetical protein M569_02214 [Genlisea aurea]|uniref:Calcineurin B-like protein n=1 Tax=Genlisea aurea TaxID=192259 RepID=S8E9J8_9LAMI|nr:hypothetical protein M569_02214 [Genlisea aurea]
MHEERSASCSVRCRQKLSHLHELRLLLRRHHVLKVHTRSPFSVSYLSRSMNFVYFNPKSLRFLFSVNFLGVQPSQSASPVVVVLRGVFDVLMISDNLFSPNPDRRKSIMGCFASKSLKRVPGYEEPTLLAAETAFSVSEVEALFELFNKISCSIIRDGLIHKEEFQLALFRNQKRRNLFADRVFDLFDYKRNGVIEFGEFIRGLSVFHPNASYDSKVSFAYRLYDLRNTGFIEREELKEMVLALLHESDLVLSEDLIELIVDKTFSEADSNGDGKIDLEEWKEFVSKNPSLIRNMTLPYLKDITGAFPSFVEQSEVEESEL